MLKRLNTPPAFLCVFAAGLLAAPAQTLPRWNLVWADEFAQADGTSPDGKKWFFDTGTGSSGWGNNE